MIIRAHECVMDGFERFAQGHLITLFSATNYCGTANNAGTNGEGGAGREREKKRRGAPLPSQPRSPSLSLLSLGAILVLGRDLVMVPKLIHPLPPASHSPGSPTGEDEVGGGGAGPSGSGGTGPGGAPGGPSALDTWMQSVNEERPPTPPRGRATNGSPSLAFFE